jgi:hypothetical protein
MRRGNCEQQGSEGYDAKEGGRRGRGKVSLRVVMNRACYLRLEGSEPSSYGCVICQPRIPVRTPFIFIVFAKYQRHNPQQEPVSLGNVVK